MPKLSKLSYFAVSSFISNASFKSHSVKSIYLFKTFPIKTSAFSSLNSYCSSIALMIDLPGVENAQTGIKFDTLHDKCIEVVPIVRRAKVVEFAGPLALGKLEPVEEN